MDLKDFNQLFAEYQGRFIHFAFTYVKDQSIAEDIVIESFMYYWENHKSLKPNSNVPAYLLTTIKHKCLNYLEHVQVSEDAADNLREHAIWELQTRISTLKACEPDELFSTEAQTIVDKTLATLPAQTRNIFIMSRYKGMSHKEISEALGITTKGVEFHISKALKALRVSLKDYLPAFFFLLFH